MVAVLVALVAVLPWTAAAAQQDDAGMGRDAADSAWTASPIPGSGTYAGTAGAHDRDWYVAATPSGPVCAVVDVASEAARTVSLAFWTEAGRIRAVSKDLPAGGGRLVLSARDATRVYVGLGQAEIAAYTFDLEIVGAGADMAGDPGVPESTAGGCLVGTLSGPMAIDRYVFSGAAGQVVDVSMAATTAAVSTALIDPAGVVVDGFVSGEAQAVTLPSAGTYTLETRSSTTSAYALSLDLSDPGPQGCRPNCFEFAEL